jgi:hypothetical protein
MPTRQLQRKITVLLEDLHSAHLASLAGWVGSTHNDIDRVEWVVDKLAIPITRTLCVYKKTEANLTRWVKFTDTEVYSLVSGLPNWGGGVSVLDKVEFDAAGRTLTAYKVPEAA